MEYLACLHEDICDGDIAFSLFQEILEIRRRVLGNHHPDTARTLNNLGFMFRHKGDDEKTLSLLQEFFNIYTLCLGDNQATRHALNNLENIRAKLTKARKKKK
jgi:hypothetical protein